ncbi:hypothetical protein Gbfr_031_014 [Gluconobacter frateurii M-2]|nr:hypothetical protein Gbfr_031_014 [Gluconobacter frateurii M-2]
MSVRMPILPDEMSVGQEWLPSIRAMANVLAWMPCFWASGRVLAGKAGINMLVALKRAGY